MGRQQLRQPPGRGGLGRALLAPDQHPADEGIDGVENQGLLQTLLPDQGGEGIDGAFGGHGGNIIVFQKNGKEPLALAYSEVVLPLGFVRVEAQLLLLMTLIKFRFGACVNILLQRRREVSVLHDFFEKLPFVIRKLVNIIKRENRLYIDQSQVYWLV